ncbi:L-seryl-tRNA(Sec) selenium transferase [Actinopolymorpha sp. B17G11]|uniref:L-seryl-tRNA(Sec) selenium transferase n=1 Tax=Actinopolymorpha sp. B17G11 TaxID=3160861 RepID=UPI0032E3D89C
MTDPRRRIPATGLVLDDPRVAGAVEALGRPAVKATVTEVQRRARAGQVAPEDVVDVVLAALPRHTTSLRTVINATGVIVHTNLGRAALSAAAREALQVAAGPTNVEFDLATGARARRGRGALDALADAVPEAGGVHIVNNNAAALLLAAMTLAGTNGEILLSRGEFVEIGDGFRIPELLAASGVHIREVGTTNRTTLDDYRRAIGPRTGFVLRIHPSNFVITGFTAAPTVDELATLDVPVVVDIGSGLLRPHPRLPDEPDASSTLRAGATLVTASGDKLLGGPQAGLLLGAAEVVEKLRRHPAARAFRVDKLTLAALEATLRGPAPPVVAALDADPDDLRARAVWLARSVTDSGIAVDVVSCVSVVGGGGAPEVELASWGLGVPADWAAPLRLGDPPVVGRVWRDRCVLDLRTVPDDADNHLLGAVKAAHARCTS